MEETKRVLNEQANRAMNYRNSPPGGIGMPEGLMFFFGIAMLIAAVFVYIKRDNTEGAKFVETAQNIQGDINALKESFVVFQKSQTEVCGNFSEEIADLKKKTREPQHVSYEFPKSIPVSVTIVEKHELAKAQTTVGVQEFHAQKSTPNTFHKGPVKSQ
jgi:hypothetical protein